jgi:hypothetical protein
VASVVSPVTVTPSVRGNLPLKLSFDGGAAIEGKIDRIHKIEAIKTMPAGRERTDDPWFLRRKEKREATWEDVFIRKEGFVGKLLGVPVESQDSGNAVHDTSAFFSVRLVRRPRLARVGNTHI